MPNVALTRQMQDYAERQVEAGLYGNLSEVVRAGIRRLMEDEGAAAFERLRRDIARRMEQPTEEADLHDLLYGDLEAETTPVAD